MSRTWTVLEILRATATFLEGRGSESARLDAEVLLAHVLGLARIELYTGHDRPLVPAELDAYREAVRRRGESEPVAYILGEKEFRSLAFRVTPAVLVPRPETEHLVEEALAALEGRSDPVVADVGTGSGCVAVSLAVARPDLRALAVDRSADALAIAAENAERHGVADRVRLLEGDGLEPIFAEGARVDLLVSNPPYVSEEEWAELDRDVRDHEPKGALVPGPDPLRFYRLLLERGPQVLRGGGAIVLELPGSRTEEIRALAPGGTELQVLSDYAGLDRVLVARPVGG
jgi:release factor glutamine methyltransferase